MRWKLFAIQNPNTMKQKQTYGFNTSNSPPPMKELKLFEEDMFEMIKKIEFRTVRNDFQKKLKQDINVIKKTPEIITSADKTQNKYTVSIDDYSKMLQENITKEYKKTTADYVQSTNKEAANLAKDLGIADRVDQFIQADPFITVKDHKEQFPSKVQCRLINPAKSTLVKSANRLLRT